MAKHIPVPPDLEHLIEKRDTENDRRKQKLLDDLAAQAGDVSAADKPPVPPIPERRRKQRRKSDS